MLSELKIPLAFAMWYLMSIVYSLVNKEVLKVWKFPCVFSAVQLLVGGLWVSLLWAPLPLPGRKGHCRLRAPPTLSWAEQKKLLKVSVFLALGHLWSTVSPAYGTVAFSNVVKTAEPLLTCFFSAVLFGEVFSLPVYLTLVPVIAGVCTCVWSEVSFSMVALVSGLLSNVCFAMRAILSKRVMQRPLGQGLSAQNLYGVLTLQSLAMLLPLCLIVEGRSIVAGTAATLREVGAARFAKMLLYTGMSHYMYNECAFLALSSVHPVTHAVANTVKRVAVIVSSVLFFHDPMTLSGAIGSAIAVAGVLLYSVAKAQWAAQQVATNS